MKRFFPLALLAALLFVAGPGQVQAGQLYKYTDENGDVHVVDDPRKIPMRYREDMETRRARTPTGPEESSGEGGEEGASGGKEGDAYTGEVPTGDVDLTGLPPDIDPATVVGKDPKTGKFILDPGRPGRLEKEKKASEDLEKKQKLGQADKEGHDEAYWRKKIADCRSELRKAEDNYRSAEQTFLNNPDYAQTPKDRAVVDRLKGAFERKKSECDRIPGEARSAGAPPGWVL